jgi:predicted nucleic acid-binding protein
VERYADRRIGLADASVVVLAQRHRTLDLLCTDERHFRVLEENAKCRMQKSPLRFAF